MAGYYDDSRRPDRSFLSILSLIAPLRVQIVKDNELTVSLIKGRNGQLRHYREIAPFVWRDTNSNWRMAAKVVDGRVVAHAAWTSSRRSWCSIPDPGWRSPAWLYPRRWWRSAQCCSPALLWPVAAIVRRRYKVPLAVDGARVQGAPYSRVGAVALAAISVAWVIVVLLGLSHLGVFTAALDPLAAAAVFAVRDHLHRRRHRRAWCVSIAWSTRGRGQRACGAACSASPRWCCCTSPGSIT